MKDFFIGAFYTLVALICLCAIGWFFAGNDLAMFKFFAPRQEQVRRDTFEQSKAYRQGAIQELDNMRFEYIKASPEQKAALASIIRHRAADVPADALTPELYSFIKELP